MATADARALARELPGWQPGDLGSVDRVVLALAAQGNDLAGGVAARAGVSAGTCRKALADPDLFAPTNPDVRLRVCWRLTARGQARAAELTRAACELTGMSIRSAAEALLGVPRPNVPTPEPIVAEYVASWRCASCGVRGRATESVDDSIRCPNCRQTTLEPAPTEGEKTHG